MKIKPRHLILIFIFLTYFSIRIYFSLQTEYFDDDYSYFALRQIENILKTGKPIFHDNLSYGGRTFYFMPLYFYILSLFCLFFPKIIIIKILNNFFASTIIIAIYLIIAHTMKNRNVAIICSLLAATFPNYINETLNKISPYSIFFPCFLFLIYFFIQLEKNNLSVLIFFTILTVLTNFSYVLVIGFLIYFLLTYIENIEIETIKKEYLVFFAFFYIWATFIVYKNAILMNGVSFIWENTPKLLMEKYFTNINISLAITSLGILPIFFGIFSSYNYIVKRKNKNVLFIISMLLSSILLFWLKLIPQTLALMFIGTTLTILFGQFLTDFFSEFKKTKFFTHENKVYFGLIIFLLISHVIPSYFLMANIKTPNKEYFELFKWLNNIEKDSTVLSIPDEGHLITYFGKRKNVIDTNYIGIIDANTRLQDIFNIYKKNLKIENLKLIEKYDINYIIQTNKLLYYNITETPFLKTECFDIVFSNKEGTIYKRNNKCELKTL